MLKLHSGAAALAAALFICGLNAVILREAQAAAQFSVSPLLLNLPADKLAAPLTLGNQGSQAVTVQTELVSWNQDSGEDAFSAATGMVVSPPIFSIAAGANQVVRVGRLKRGAAPQRELAYRIRLAEVPPEALVKENAVATVMQISLPVFVTPADKKAAAVLEVTALMQANGDLRLKVGNSGLIHGKLTRLILMQDGKLLAERALNYYVLAGAKRELAWPGALKAAQPGAVELKVQLEGRNKFILQTLKIEAAAPVPAAN